MQQGRREGGFEELSSPFRVKGSTTFFLIPFLPLERRLFCRTKTKMENRVSSLYYMHSHTSDDGSFRPPAHSTPPSFPPTPSPVPFDSFLR